MGRHPKPVTQLAFLTACMGRQLSPAYRKWRQSFLGGDAERALVIEVTEGAFGWSMPPGRGPIAERWATDGLRGFQASAHTAYLKATSGAATPFHHPRSQTQGRRGQVCRQTKPRLGHDDTNGDPGVAARNIRARWSAPRLVLRGQQPPSLGRATEAVRRTDCDTPPHLRTQTKVRAPTHGTCDSHADREVCLC